MIGPTRLFELGTHSCLWLQSSNIFCCLTKHRHSSAVTMAGDSREAAAAASSFSLSFKSQKGKSSKSAARHEPSQLAGFAETSAAGSKQPRANWSSRCHRARLQVEDHELFVLTGAAFPAELKNIAGQDRL